MGQRFGNGEGLWNRFGLSHSTFAVWWFSSQSSVVWMGSFDLTEVLCAYTNFFRINSLLTLARLRNRMCVAGSQIKSVVECRAHPCPNRPWRASPAARAKLQTQPAVHQDLNQKETI